MHGDGRLRPIARIDSSCRVTLYEDLTMSFRLQHHHGHHHHHPRPGVGDLDVPLS